MKKDKGSGLVPRLRFPEFRNAPEWEEKDLGDVSEVLMCKRIFASETNSNQGVPFYKIGTLGGVPDAFISKELFEEYKSKYNFPRIGEILISCSGTVGKCLPYDGKEAYFQDSNIVWIDNPTLEVSNEFLLSILANVNWSTLNSTTITRIYGPDLRGLAIKFPKNETEQKRIADCLGSLDDLIAAEGEKLGALSRHKRGLMQQLFPQEGERVPRLRFGEFRDGPGWEEKPIDEIARVTQGGTPDTSVAEYWGGSINWLTPAEMGKADTPYIKSTARTLTDLGLKSCSSELLPECSVIVSTRAPIGYLAINTSPMAINQGCRGLVIARDSCAYFIYSALAYAKPRLIDLGAGNTFKELSGNALKSFRINIPLLAEQQKIASCLSSLDEQIATQARRIEALKLHKQGLLQQLFPSLEGNEG